MMAGDRNESVSDSRLRAIREFYSRNWPGGELVRLLEELEARRKADAAGMQSRD